jgi:hypothetical protein
MDYKKDLCLSFNEDGYHLQKLKFNNLGHTFWTYIQKCMTFVLGIVLIFLTQWNDNFPKFLKKK